MARRAGWGLLVAAVLVAGCSPFRLVPEGRAADPDLFPDQPVAAGPVIELGVVPGHGGRQVTYEGFRTVDGQTCIRSDTGMSCWEGERGDIPSLPASNSLGMGWGGGGDEWCLEAEVQDGVGRVVVVDADRISRELTHLPAARQLGVNLFVGCWDGAEPKVVDVYGDGDELAYREDL